MSDVLTKNQVIAVEKEDTEGTYKAPTASNKYIDVLPDGFDMGKSKEVIERNRFGSIGKSQTLDGMKTATGAIPVEAKAGAVEGSAPEYDVLMHSGMGAKRTIASEVTTLTDNTESILKVPDASVYAPGDIVMLKEDGNFYVGAIKATDTGADTIELVNPRATPFADNVVISKSTIYTVAESGHPSLSVSRWLNNAVLQKFMGCKVNSFSLEGFATAQIPSWNFGVQGMNFDSILQAVPHTPVYGSNKAPIILEAYAFMDGQSICINELTLSVENTLGVKTCINNANGKDSQRVSERVVSGTINPYMKDDSIANFTKFKNNTPFSIFAYAKVPSEVDGEFSGVVAIYMPNCTMTELAEADADGYMQETISFSANRGISGTIPEIYIAFI